MRFHLADITRAALPAALLGAALSLSGPAYAETAADGSRLEGILTVQWGDPIPGSLAHAVRYQLHTADGGVVPLDVSDAKHLEAVAAFGTRVAITGRAGRADGGTDAISVDTITPLEAGDTLERRATKTRKVLFILLKFQGDTQTPHTPAFYKALNNPLTPSPGMGIPGTVNGFYKEASWNKLQFQADVVGAGGLSATNWLTLPGTKSTYAPCGFSSACFDFTKATNDALALARAQGVEPGNYDNLSLVFNNDLDCCAWGGGWSINGKALGITWMPPWSQEASVYVHEYGHSIGLPHSGWRYYAYDSKWDQMSDGAAASSLNCGTYNSANSGGVRNLTCEAAGAGYIAAHKEKLGWLTTANIATISTAGTRTITLDSIGTPLGRLAKMIRICLPGLPCTGTSAHYLTVETKVRAATSEKGLPGEGVIIHDFVGNRAPIGGTCFFNSQSGWAVPIDATPGDYAGAPTCNSGGRVFPNYALHNAQFGVGKTYTDRARGVSVTVSNRSGNAFVVKVTRTK